MTPITLPYFIKPPTFWILVIYNTLLAVCSVVNFIGFPDLHKIAFESPKLKHKKYLPKIIKPHTVQPPFYHFLNLAYF